MVQQDFLLLWEEGGGKVGWGQKRDVTEVDCPYCHQLLSCMHLKFYPQKPLVTLIFSLVLACKYSIHSFVLPFLRIFYSSDSLESHNILVGAAATV